MMNWQFEMLATYNAWANERLYGAVSKLMDDDYRADQGAFFGSLHGTLNHLLLGDRIWMRRFTGEGDEPTALDAILYEAFEDLWSARRIEDGRISDYVGRLSSDNLKATVRYRTTRDPMDIEQYLSPLLIHFFNHQTHHRGQAHVLLTRLTGEAPSLDLLIFQRASGISLVNGAGGVFDRPEHRAARRVLEDRS